MNRTPSDNPDLSEQTETPSNRAVTIRDVARLVGVSAGTVSRAIHNSPLVNKHTRERIMTVVEQLGYKPNLAARGLVLKRTLTVAVLAPFPATAHVANCLSGIAEALADSDYRLIFRSIPSDPGAGRRFVAIPGRSEADAVLVVSVVPTAEERALLARSEVPVVFVGTDDDSLADFDQVSVDDLAAGSAAARNLIALAMSRSV